MKLPPTPDDLLAHLRTRVTGALANALTDPTIAPLLNQAIGTFTKLAQVNPDLAARLLSLLTTTHHNSSSDDTIIDLDDTAIVDHTTPTENSDPSYDTLRQHHHDTIDALRRLTALRPYTANPAFPAMVTHELTNIDQLLGRIGQP